MLRDISVSRKVALPAGLGIQPTADRPPVSGGGVACLGGSDCQV